MSARAMPDQIFAMRQTGSVVLNMGDRLIGIKVTQAEMLEKHGVARPLPSGEWIATDRESADRLLNEHPEVGECDFCAHPDITWEFPCVDFISPDDDIASEGSWGACEECATLIIRGDRRALAERSFENYCRKRQIPRKMRRQNRNELLRQIGSSHGDFFGHRIGEGINLTARWLVEIASEGSLRREEE